jgi:hypothetical protein
MLIGSSGSKLCWVANIAATARAGDVDLGANVLDVAGGRLRRDDQPLGDLLVGHAVREALAHDWFHLLLAG